jgi:hypothetical protein
VAETAVKKDLNAAAVDALCQCVSVLVEDVFSMFEYHMFYVLYPFVTYLLTYSRTVY